MKKIITIIFLSICFVNSYAQSNVTLVIDVDYDNMKDTIVFDKEQAIIITKISSQKFKPVNSLRLDVKSINTGIRITNMGFEYFQEFMRSGVNSIFSYDKTRKKIALVAINNYSFGNIAGDEEGKASIDLLKNKFNGSWNYYDDETEQYFKMSVKNRQLTLPKTYLQTYNDVILKKYFEYEAQYLEEEKAKIKEELEIKLYAKDSIEYKRQFKDALGNHILQVKVYNPCRDTPPFDGNLTLIRATIKTGEKNIRFSYNYPNPEMALIAFEPEEIILKKISNKTYIFIPFYLCGSEETFDKNVSYIVFYENRHYFIEIPYYCKSETNCKPKEDINLTLNELPTELKSIFISYLNKKHRYRSSFKG